MNLLSKYLNYEFIKNISVVSIGLILLFAFFDFLAEIGDIGNNYGLPEIIDIVFLSMPGHLYELFPISCLIGAMFTVGQLSANSEFVVMRSSGLSIKKISFNLIYVAIFFGVLTFLVGNFITPISEKNAQQIKISSADGSVTTDFRSGIWMKDGTNFVNIENILPDASMQKIHIYEFDNLFNLRSIIDADEGTYEKGSWVLKNIKQSLINNENFKVVNFDTGNWKSMIKPEMMNVLLISPDKMSLFDLKDFINFLNKNNQKTSRYEVSLWEKIIQPVMPIIMILFAIPFGFFQERSGGKYLKMFLGIAFGIAYQISNSLFRHVGIINDWNLIITAIIPSFIILSVGLVIFFKVERQ